MHVLDTSAVIALLVGEPGADRVQALLPDVVISAVNWAEVVGFYARAGYSEPEIADVLRAGPRIPVRAADAVTAASAGRLVPATRHLGLSLGDRFCLALAIQERTTVLTGDRAWGQLAIEGLTVELIR